MRFSEARKQKVVSTSSATTVGRVDGFVVDATAGRVVALLLKKTPGDGDLLRWADLTAFGRDAVTVPGAESLTSATGDLAVLADSHHDVVGKLVLTDAGVAVGKVVDVDFDLTDGTVLTLITDRDEIPGTSMLAIGSYALMVRTAP